MKQHLKRLVTRYIPSRETIQAACHFRRCNLTETILTFKLKKYVPHPKKPNVKIAEIRVYELHQKGEDEFFASHTVIAGPKADCSKHVFQTPIKTKQEIAEDAKLFLNMMRKVCNYKVIETSGSCETFENLCCEAV